MRLRLNSLSIRAFSLIEVIIAVGILTSAVVFIMRAFTTMLCAAKRSQNIILACLLTEDKAWEIEEKEKDGIKLEPQASGQEKMQEREFSWEYRITDSENPDFKNLKKLEFDVLWQENVREKEKNSISTYLISK